MIPVGSHPVWHPLFEALAYGIGYAVYRSRRSLSGDMLSDSQRWVVIASAAVGAVLGSRILGVAEQWPTVLMSIHSGRFLALVMSPGGKTIVGGLLGGWLAVELTKRSAHIHRKTGDLFALPLCIGIGVGRIGCFLAGLADDTFGNPTRLPWGVNLGDGISRHPVQIYEILFLAVLAIIVTGPANWPEGYRFRLFMAGYLSWRLTIDFLKPQPLLAGLNLIQWACAVGLTILAVLFISDIRVLRRKDTIGAAIA